MSEQLRIILIIIVSVSIFGLIVFVMVKNFVRNKIQFYLEEKNKKTRFGVSGNIATKNSRACWVIATNEEWVIAEQSTQLLTNLVK